MSAGGRDPSCCQRLGCLEQPAQRLERFAAAELVLEVSMRVDHGALQHVQLVVQRVELAAGHHQLTVAERQLTGPLTRHPVPLAAALRAELPRTTRPLAGGQDRTAPPAPSLGTLPLLAGR